MVEENRRFTVALSYPGERREFVSLVAACLSERLGQSKVLYDKYHEAEFAQPDLDVYLPTLYRTASDLIVIFLCDEYALKRWCKLEWRSIRQLLDTAEKSRIMFLSFDEVGAIPEIGILSGDGYAFIGQRSPEEIAGLIFQRLGFQGHRAVSRVCFISSEYPPKVSGGLGVHVQQLTRALSEHLDVDIALSYTGFQEYQESLPRRIHILQLTNSNPSYADPVSWLYFAMD